MGLQITAQVLCDNCNGINTPATPLVNQDAPLPNDWCRVQGYANTSNGNSEAIDGYYCPICVVQQGTKALVKKTADISSDLTEPEQS